MSASKGQLLRLAIKEQQPLLAMGAFDAMTMRMVDRAGFRAAYIGSFATAASVAGLPDFGLLSATEMADQMNRLASATSLPCIADGDTGYGNAINVQRTVQLFEAAGVAAIQIEDQVSPKKCGHIAGKDVIPGDQMVQKVRAAVAARKDPDFLIIARSDARAVHGIDDAIARCRAYAEAGADVLFVDAPESLNEIERIGKELKKTSKLQLFNMAPTGKSPKIGAKQLAAFGFDIIIFPIEAILAAYPAILEVMSTIRRDGSSEAMTNRMASFKDITNLLDLDLYYEKEREFAG